MSHDNTCRFNLMSNGEVAHHHSSLDSKSRKPSNSSLIILVMDYQFLFVPIMELPYTLENGSKWGGNDGKMTGPVRGWAVFHSWGIRSLLWRIVMHITSVLLHFFQYSAALLSSPSCDLTNEHPMVDYTPPSYITLLFTDLGILTPSAVSDELIKLYLWCVVLHY